MEKITFCIPSKNNKRYLEACIPSIRRNSFRDDHDIIVFVDEDKDGTVEWLNSVKEKYNINFDVNNTGKLYGIGRAYDHCVKNSKTDIFMIFHADMMLGKHADLEAFKHLGKNKVVCSTRIEPPLHPSGPEKIIKDFGLWPEKDVEDGWKEKEFDEFVEKTKIENKDMTTNGCFAPWMMYKTDFVAIGGHDFKFHSCREDSDVFNRCVLAGYELIQSWESYVYHLTARAGQFQHGKLTQDHSQKSKEWREMMDASTREYFRKWGSLVNHDRYMMPIITPKYKITFILKNTDYGLLYNLEPWCSKIIIDYQGIVDSYIQHEQKNTSYNLSERVKFSWEKPHIEHTKIDDIVVEFDCNEFDESKHYNFIHSLSAIIQDSGEIGKMNYDIFKLTINSMESYEKENIINGSNKIIS